jgi:ribosomal protein S1
VLPIGEVVRGTVTRAEVYGLYLSCRGHETLVLIPDLAWVPVARDCRDFAQVGDEFDVKVLLFNEETGTYRGSIKDAHPEDDPWRDPTAFRPGTVWDGTVTHPIMGGRGEGGLVGYMVRLRPGVSGLLMVGEIGEDLAVGDRVGVRVAEVDEPSQKVRLVPWRPGPGGE